MMGEGKPSYTSENYEKEGIMKVIICDKLETEAVERMLSAGLEVDVRDDITPEELAEVIQDYHGMVVRSRTKVRIPLIDKAHNLKVIVRGGVGIDNIDADYASEKGITVHNTPGASSVSVAELTIGYMFALARQLCQAAGSMKAGKWEKKRFEGSEVGGKTLGIIGLGRIGIEVARRAHALGMDILVYDPYIKDTDYGNLVSLKELLLRADFLTFHLPLTEETHNMISTKEFEIMKTGVYIVDCARGGIVDEEALYKALLEGKVAGAALDVFAEEPVHGHKLFSLDQVIGSPHIGAATKEAQSRIGAEVAEKLIFFSQTPGL
jgi:D-3-phosphoglycerate dehydrogenase / 2-oxoglutarate reductase